MSDATEWFWKNVNDIKATLKSCDKCDGDGVILCPNCNGNPFCSKCGSIYPDDYSHCYHECEGGEAIYDCPNCKKEKPTCQECQGKGYQIDYYELDGKSAPTIDALYRKFVMPILRNRFGEVVRFQPSNFGYDVVIDRNHLSSLPFGKLQVSATGWVFEDNGGKAHAGKVDDEFLDNARNAIHKLYCEVAL